MMSDMESDIRHFGKEMEESWKDHNLKQHDYLI